MRSVEHGLARTRLWRRKCASGRSLRWRPGCLYRRFRPLGLAGTWREFRTVAVWTGWRNLGCRRGVSLITGVSSKHRCQERLRSQVMKRARDGPFQRESHWSEDVAHQFQKLRILVGIAVGVGPILPLRLRPRDSRQPQHQNNTQTNHNSSHNSDFVPAGRTLSTRQVH